MRIKKWIPVILVVLLAAGGIAFMLLPTDGPTAPPTAPIKTPPPAEPAAEPSEAPPDPAYSESLDDASDGDTSGLIPELPPIDEDKTYPTPFAPPPLAPPDESSD